jgi:hypothetical protein
MCSLAELCRMNSTIMNDDDNNNNNSIKFIPLFDNNNNSIKCFPLFKCLPVIKISSRKTSFGETGSSR